MINARAETLAERPAFRDALATHRCLIVADGFYEWQPRTHGPKLPWWITREDHEPFAFAGLWASWRPAPDVEPLRSCTIITTQASASLREVHEPHAGDPASPAPSPAWLDHGATPAALAGLLVPFPDTTRIPVSTAVNDAGHDAPDCIEPVDPGPDEPASPTLF